MINTIITGVVELIPTVLVTVVTAIVGWIGLKLKDSINTDTKKKVVETTVKYIEQVYKDVHGADKLQIAIDSAKELLKEKGISITDLELLALIESAVREMNLSYKEAGDN